MNVYFEDIIIQTENIYDTCERADKTANDYKESFIDGTPLGGINLMKVEKCNNVLEDTEKIRTLIHKIDQICKKYINLY